MLKFEAATIFFSFFPSISYHEKLTLRTEGKLHINLKQKFTSSGLSK